MSRKFTKLSFKQLWICTICSINTKLFWTKVHINSNNCLHCKMSKSTKTPETSASIDNGNDSSSNECMRPSKEGTSIPKEIPEIPLLSKLMDSVETIREHLARLNIIQTTTPSRSTLKILNSVDLDGIAEYIHEHKCTNIITLAGAGISTSAGIPDFRSPESGIYSTLQKYKLPYPEAIFEMGQFYRNPEPFFQLAKELYPGTFKPTLTHYFIALLQQKGVLLRHYTQNIDTLERIAGIEDDKLVEAHGTFYTGHCIKCQKEYTMEWMKNQIFEDKTPKCSKCNNTVKPDIVFFGEDLPDRFYDLREMDFHKCDMLIVLGSSLVVQPFASLVDKVRDTCPRLLINREKAGQRSDILSSIGCTSGMDFDGEQNSRDVLWLGDCDDGCRQLATKLGWLEDLETLMRNHSKPAVVTHKD